MNPRDLDTVFRPPFWWHCAGCEVKFVVGWAPWIAGTSGVPLPKYCPHCGSERIAGVEP